MSGWAVVVDFEGRNEALVADPIERSPLPVLPGTGGFSCCLECGSREAYDFCPDAEAYPCPRLVTKRRAKAQAAAEAAAHKPKRRRIFRRRRQEQE